MIFILILAHYILNFNKILIKRYDTSPNIPSFIFTNQIKSRAIFWNYNRLSKYIIHPVNEQEIIEPKVIHYPAHALDYFN